LVAEPAGELGTTPLCEVPLQKGSYLLRLTLPGHAEVRYPVLIERGGHHDGCAPGDTEPHAIALPREGELCEDDCYVPAGWTLIGGDDLTSDSLSERRVWLPDFVIRRFPVTTREYLVFLNDLLERGDEAGALAACPRAPLGLAQGGQAAAFARDARGRLVLPPEHEASGGLEWPIVLVDWYAACAYAAWFAARTKQAWRLPNELEREKATRGVDGRYLPWGDFIEPMFARVLGSCAEEPTIAPVDGHPIDESVYGVRGLAGNTRDWCENVWAHDGPTTHEGALVRSPARRDDDDFRAIRGGAWASTVAHGRAAARFALRPDMVRSVVGIRLVRSLG
jgi:serine/threonine-protein kinase